MNKTKILGVALFSWPFLFIIGTLCYEHGVLTVFKVIGFIALVIAGFASFIYGIALMSGEDYEDQGVF